jgi:hypothetical protein
LPRGGTVHGERRRAVKRLENVQTVVMVEIRITQLALPETDFPYCSLEGQITFAGFVQSFRACPLLGQLAQACGFNEGKTQLQIIL